MSTDGLAGTVYRPNLGEYNALAQSYNNLGGLKGTGMDFATWNSSMGIGEVDKGFLGNTTDFLGSDAMKGVGTVAGMGFGLADILNSMSAQKQAKKQWEAENARADELMAMNKEKYNTYKADKARLNSQYA